MLILAGMNLDYACGFKRTMNYYSRQKVKKRMEQVMLHPDPQTYSDRSLQTRHVGQPHGARAGVYPDDGADFGKDRLDRVQFGPRYF